jgi:hypothetical protein
MLVAKITMDMTNASAIMLFMRLKDGMLIGGILECIKINIY